MAGLVPNMEDSFSHEEQKYESYEKHPKADDSSYSHRPNSKRIKFEIEKVSSSQVFGDNNDIGDREGHRRRKVPHREICACALARRYWGKEERPPPCLQKS